MSVSLKERTTPEESHNSRSSTYTPNKISQSQDKLQTGNKHIQRWKSQRQPQNYNKSTNPRRYLPGW
jgi:hypothetical protein